MICKRFVLRPEFVEVLTPLLFTMVDIYVEQLQTGSFPASCKKLTPLVNAYNEYMKDKTEKDLYYAVTD